MTMPTPAGPSQTAPASSYTGATRTPRRDAEAVTTPQMRPAGAGHWGAEEISGVLLGHLLPFLA